MLALLEQLEALTAGRYRIFFQLTESDLQIIWLDQQSNVVICRRLSALHLQNDALSVGVINDLEGTLMRTYALRVPQPIGIHSTPRTSTVVQVADPPYSAYVQGTLSCKEAFMSAYLNSWREKVLPDDYRDANYDTAFQAVSENCDEFRVDELEAAAKVVELTSLTDNVR